MLRQLPPRELRSNGQPARTTPCGCAGNSSRTWTASPPACTPGAASSVPAAVPCSRASGGASDRCERAGAHRTAYPRLLQLPPYHRGPRAQRGELAERRLAGEVLHPAIGRRDEPRGRHVLQGAADTLRHLFGRLDGLVAQVDDAEHDRLASEIGKDAEVELGLGGLDRDLRSRAVGELRQ